MTEDGASEEMKVVYVRSGCLDCLEHEGEPPLGAEVHWPAESCLLVFFFGAQRETGSLDQCHTFECDFAQLLCKWAVKLINRAK